MKRSSLICTSLTRRSVLGSIVASSVSALGAKAAPPLRFATAADGRRALRSNAWLEIDATAFVHNVSEYRKLVGDRLPTCAVVKGDAYGNGLALLMPAIRQAGLTFLGIASNEEARIAKAGGFRGRIMRLRASTLDEAEDGLQFGVEELVGSLEVARAFDRMATRHRTKMRVHVALNSAGMSREGIELDERGRDDARLIAQLGSLRIVGLMTHFPVNQIADMNAGLRRFQADTNLLAVVPAYADSAIQRHCANSFATLNLPASRLDLVRPGRCLFGYGGDDFPQFRHLATLKSRIASINRYPKGATVAYDRTFRLERPSMLANVPIGASDGFRTIFSHANQGVATSGRLATMIIRGKTVPVVGRVTMNTVMVDVTDIYEQISLNDEIIVFGPNAPPGNRQADLLAMAAANPPDLMTMFGNSLPKVLRPLGDTR